MPDHRHYHVYILASTYKHLYIGITSHLERRMAQHKSKSNPASFTARYNIHQLVHVELFSDVQQAIAREKELKKWNRFRKVALIVANNPTWKDLSLDSGKQIAPFAETTPNPPIIS